MEYIKKEELIIGEIYNCSSYLNKYIVKLTNTHYGCININKANPYLHKSGNFNANDLQWSLATPEEKHWLNECIKLDKFITFEEAMKTFIPEYVEAVSNKHSSSEIIGNIYKTSELPKWVQGHKLEEYWKDYMFHYKPSIKEAYDAQFVVKEPEFVLPEKWCVLRNLDNYSIINNWFLKNQIKTWAISDIKGYLHSTILNGNWINSNSKKEDYTEITFEQFKKYVLKEEIVEEKVIEPLPQFKVIETVETITKVENNEGNQFFIGDVVKSVSGIVQKIESFQYNRDNTQILAFTDYRSLTGIGINKLEHYIETGISLNEIKEKYPIGTFVKSVISSKVVEIKDYDLFHSNTNGNVLSYNQGSIILYQDKVWAEKVEVKDQFILPKRWFIKTTEETFKTIRKWSIEKSNYNYSGYRHYHYVSFNYLGKYRQEQYCTEITFDQFKKYVLKEEQPVVIAESHKDMLNLKIKGIDSIVLPQESLLDKAKRLYPVGTKIYSALYPEDKYESVVLGWSQSGNEIFCLNTSNNPSCHLYHNNRWGEIIEYPHGFKVGDKIRSKYGNTIYQINKIEGNQLFFMTNSLPKINSILAKNAIKVN